MTKTMKIGTAIALALPLMLNAAPASATHVCHFSNGDMKPCTNVVVDDEWFDSHAEGRFMLKGMQGSAYWPCDQEFSLSEGQHINYAMWNKVTDCNCVLAFGDHSDLAELGPYITVIVNDEFVDPVVAEKRLAGLFAPPYRLDGLIPGAPIAVSTYCAKKLDLTEGQHINFSPMVGKIIDCNSQGPPG